MIRTNLILALTGLAFVGCDRPADDLHDSQGGPIGRGFESYYTSAGPE